MPWKECHVVDERLRFVGRMLDAEKMAPLCAEFGISRKTGSRSATPEHRQSEAASRADRALRRFYPRVTRPQQSSRTLKLWMERVLSSNRVPAAYVSGRPVPIAYACRDSSPAGLMAGKPLSTSTVYPDLTGPKRP